MPHIGDTTEYVEQTAAGLATGDFIITVDISAGGTYGHLKHLPVSEALLKFQPYDEGLLQIASLADPDTGTGTSTPVNPLLYYNNETSSYDFLELGSELVIAAGTVRFTPTDGNTLYVSSLGNDATAQVDSPHLPYLTLSAAKAAASSGDTIYVLPGNYTGDNLLKNGVNWYGELGANLTLSSGTGGAIFDDGDTGANTAITCSIIWHGTLISSHPRTGDHASIASFWPKILSVTQTNSDIFFQFAQITMSYSAVTSGSVHIGIWQEAGRITARGNRIYSTASSPVYWINGEFHGEVVEILADDPCYEPLIYVVASGVQTGQFYLRSDLVYNRATDAGGAPDVIEVNGEATARVWLDILQIKNDGAGAVYLNGPYVYLRSQKIGVAANDSTDVMAITSVGSNGNYYIEVDKVEGGSSAKAPVSLQGGNSWISIKELTNLNSFGTALRVINAGTHFVSVTDCKAGGVTVSTGTLNLSASNVIGNVSQSSGTLTLSDCAITGNLSGTLNKRGFVYVSGSDTSVATWQGSEPLSSLGGQPLDADLTAIAALVGTTGFLTKTGVNTWVLDTNTYLTAAAADALFLTPAEGNAAYQPLDADLTAIAALTTATYGRSLLTLANATALAAEVDSFFLTPTEGNSAYQPLDSDLTAIAALATTAFGRGFLTETNAASVITTLGLAALYQPLSTNLTQIAALVDPAVGTGTGTGQDEAPLLYWNNLTSAFDFLDLGAGFLIAGGVLHLTSTGGGTPGGSDTQVQFNDSSAFGGDAGLVFNKTTNALTVHGGVVLGDGTNAGAITVTAPGSGAGNNATVTASAAASGNTNGGNVVATPGLKAGAGADGTVISKAASSSPASLHEFQGSAGGVYVLVKVDNTSGYDGGVIQVQRQAATTVYAKLMAQAAVGLVFADNGGGTNGFTREAGIFGARIYAKEAGRGETGLFFGLNAGGTDQGATNSILPSTDALNVDNTINLGLPAFRFKGIHTVYTLSGFLVEANTAGSGAPNVLTVGESRTLLTNEGASAENYHTLPLAVAGLSFLFIVQDSDGIRIVANTGDTIRPIAGTAASAAAGFIRCATLGAFIRLVAINATEWIAIGSAGTWTIDV